MERINKTGFNIPLNEFVSNGGIYVGVSAGSYVAAGNFSDSLAHMKLFNYKTFLSICSNVGAFLKRQIPALCLEGRKSEQKNDHTMQTSHKSSLLSVRQLYQSYCQIGRLDVTLDTTAKAKRTQILWALCVPWPGFPIVQDLL